MVLVLALVVAANMVKLKKEHLVDSRYSNKTKVQQ